jgi:hypothetical protein
VCALPVCVCVCVHPLPRAPRGGFYAPLVAYAFQPLVAWAQAASAGGSPTLAVAMYGTMGALVVGKGIAVVAELWFVRQYFTSLLDDDVAKAKSH